MFQRGANFQTCSRRMVDIVMRNLSLQIRERDPRRPLQCSDPSFFFFFPTMNRRAERREAEVTGEMSGRVYVNKLVSWWFVYTYKHKRREDTHICEINAVVVVVYQCGWRDARDDLVAPTKKGPDGGLWIGRDRRRVAIYEDARRPRKRIIHLQPIHRDFFSFSFLFRGEGEINKTPFPGSITSFFHQKNRDGYLMSAGWSLVSFILSAYHVQMEK